MYILKEYDSVDDKEGREVASFETFEEAEEYIDDSDEYIRCFLSIEEVI